MVDLELLKKYKKDFIWFLDTFIILFIMKYQFLDLPFYYEEKPYTIASVDTFSYLDIFFSSFPRGEFAHHQPLLPVLTNFWASIFGFSSFNVHFLMLILSSLGLYFLLKLYEQLKPKIKSYLWLPALLLISSPSIFIHSTNYRYDIFTMVLGIAYLYFRVSKKYMAYIITGCLLAYSRETTIGFIASVFIVEVLFIRNKKLVLINVLHGFVWAFYFIVNKISNGAFSTSVAQNQIVSSLSEYLNILLFDLKWIFVEEYRFVLTAMILFSIIKLKNYKNRNLLLLLPIGFYCLGMSFHSLEASYYLLPVLPCFYLLASLEIQKVVKPKYLNFLIPIWIGFSINLNLNLGKLDMAENSVYYKDIVENYKESIQYIEKNFENKNIYMEWPLLYYAVDYSYGYINSKEIKNNFESIAEKNHIWASKLGHDSNVDFDCTKIDYVVIASQSNHLQQDVQREVIKKCHMSGIKEIKNSISSVIIYSK